jgi:hypothetical protein
MNLCVRFCKILELFISAEGALAAMQIKVLQLTPYISKSHSFKSSEWRRKSTNGGIQTVALVHTHSLLTCLQR